MPQPDPRAVPPEPEDADDDAPDDYEPVYRDGSLQNECWRSEE